MAKSIRRIFTTILALCICTCMIVPQALAAEITTETTTEGGITTTVTTTTETVVEDEKTTTTETVETTTEGTDEEGVTVSGEETSTTTTITEADGTITEIGTTDGSETKTWTEEDAGNEPGQPEVEVELKPGETTAATATETVVEGEINSEDGQTTTTTTDRTVEATTSESEIIVESEGSSEFDPIQTDSDLSLLLAKKATESILYSYDPEQALGNRVDAQIH